MISTFLSKIEESNHGPRAHGDLHPAFFVQPDRRDGFSALAAQVYKVDVDAISTRVKQEFAAKEKITRTKKAAA